MISIIVDHFVGLLPFRQLFVQCTKHTQMPPLFTATAREKGGNSKSGWEQQKNEFSAQKIATLKNENFWNWCLKTIWRYVMSVHFELKRSLHTIGEVSIACVKTNMLKACSCWSLESRLEWYDTFLQISNFQCNFWFAWGDGAPILQWAQNSKSDWKYSTVNQNNPRLCNVWKRNI